ncbi:hypothetical protein [Streptomyces phage phiSAJS1]|uniref:hypothetical protein n=1 Tax=Streptomyces phage phiSAJS1 TaxID=1755682 RepID=UPI000720045D|nr:hypothetical protein AVT91_p09 [Streptomyces phage phiSAJS1]ALO79408.1 hypothetical protein [Streptomyces phage phiSAJS1]
MVGGVYHYGSPTGTVIPKKYVDPKKGTLKPGVTVSPKGKVNMTKPGGTTGSSNQKPGATKPGGSGTVKQPSAPKAPAPAPAPRVRTGR